jgi:hypothetical protein
MGTGQKYEKIEDEELFKKASFIYLFAAFCISE